jgi:hypothetical protein
MEAEHRHRRVRGNEVRFVLSVGDDLFGLRQTGTADRDWVSNLFLPARQLCAKSCSTWQRATTTATRPAIRRTGNMLFTVAGSGGQLEGSNLNSRIAANDNVAGAPREPRNSPFRRWSSRSGASHQHRRRGRSTADCRQAHAGIAAPRRPWLNGSEIERYDRGLHAAI